MSEETAQEAAFLVPQALLQHILLWPFTGLSCSMQNMIFFHSLFPQLSFAFESVCEMSLTRLSDAGHQFTQHYLDDCILV